MVSRDPRRRRLSGAFHGHPDSRWPMGDQMGVLTLHSAPPLSAGNCWRSPSCLPILKAHLLQPACWHVPAVPPTLLPPTPYPPTLLPSVSFSAPSSSDHPGNKGVPQIPTLCQLPSSLHTVLCTRARPGMRDAREGMRLGNISKRVVSGALTACQTFYSPDVVYPHVSPKEV